MPTIVAQKAPAPELPKAAVAASKPRPRKTVRPAPVQLATRPAEVEFLALPYAPPLLPEDQGQVIRIRLPRSAIGRLGFPVNQERFSDRIPADILMGEDGIARGIRLVRASDMR